MKEYKINEWQINKLREGFNNHNDDSDPELEEQCLMILDAIERTEGTEMEPIYIPSCWISDKDSYAETIDCTGYTTTYTGDVKI